MVKAEQERILIFGKDVEFMTSLCEILSKVGYLVSGSSSWENTLEALKNQSFALFLTDIEMPDMDGIALMRAAMKINQHLVSIIIIGQETIRIPIDTVEIGAFDYVKKPFKLEELLMKISHAMEVSRLRKSEDMYRSIFENAAEGIYLLTSEEKYIAANLTLAHIFGYESPDDLMTNLTDNVHKLYVEPDRHSKFINLIKKINVVMGFESQVYRKDGGKIWISENACAVRDTNGNVLYYRGTVEDITMRKKAEEELHMSETHFRLWAEKNEKNKDVFLDVINDLCDSYRKLEGLFMSFVIAIVNALDERRPWNKGHSLRVASYSLKIAKEMGLNDDEMKKIRLAALLHDIGQALYDELIDKPTKLSDAEFELIKKHPLQGATILKRIKQLNDIIPIVRHHHERMDGKGYPDGLKGDEIPVGARILHVADSFDSMTADRPYRPAPGKEYAFLEFKRNNNTQFDPKVAEIALKVL